MNYLSVDYHKKYSQVTVMDEKGEILKEGRIDNGLESVSEVFEGLEGPTTAVMEATRNWSLMYDRLEQFADEVKLAHPMKVKAIASAKIKTDKIDSRVLAHLLRSDLIPAAHVPNKDMRIVRGVLRQRLFFVRIRTMVKNRIHTLVDRYPEIERCQGMETDIFGKSGMTWLLSIELPPASRRLLDAELELLETLNDKIKASDKWVKELGKDNEDVSLLQTIPGIGKFFSVLLWAEIDGIERFANAKKLASYAGLVPSVHSSGGKTYHGRITKTGNKWIRWALVEAVHPAIRKDYWLRCQYEKRKRRNGTNKAKVAMARKHLSIIYRVLSERSPYMPVRGQINQSTKDNNKREKNLAVPSDI